MNKNVLRASLATAAIIPAIILGIGSGTATAKPTLIGDPGAPVDIQLSSDVPAAAPVPESWSCAVLQGLNLGFESGSGLKIGNKVQVNPMIGDWNTVAPVTGFCLGSQGFTSIPGSPQ
ncbi:hypothetical protein [Rhodococcus koreensis]|uniref:Uncharacterized protein n=1 Tax=Rhodococcus koreensis TaxID=99653 RepID=A0A1H4I6G2_9NOCA|nr:hypothetical protein [Rhodococcus koreensis]SEB29500.1 hypothetical protein SAMN04490239_0100 [Rhodococcus koreensis]